MSSSKFSKGTAHNDKLNTVISRYYGDVNGNVAVNLVAFHKFDINVFIKKLLCSSNEKGNNDSIYIRLTNMSMFNLPTLKQPNYNMLDVSVAIK